MTLPIVLAFASGVFYGALGMAWFTVRRDARHLETSRLARLRTVTADQRYSREGDRL